MGTTASVFRKLSNFEDMQSRFPSTYITSHQKDNSLHIEEIILNLLGFRYLGTSAIYETKILLYELH
jgi:hypothetical protein